LSPRRFDPALSLPVVAAAVVVIASLVVHRDLVDQDRRQQRQSAAATAELVATRLEGSLRDTLSTLEAAAASAPARLDQRTETLRARGTVTAVARVAADGHTPTTTLVGDAAAPQPVTVAALNAARDSGEARLERVPGRPGLVAVAPIYRGLPRGTAERRMLLDGYVLASVDVTKLVQDSIPFDVAPELRLTDGAAVVATAGGTAGRGSRFPQPVAVGGAAYVLTLTGPTAPPRSAVPAWRRSGPDGERSSPPPSGGRS
jgi:sensor domain CHASE-containing protein